ncbi:MAG: hypothetical protein ACOX24_07330 [Christensenellales bacterium]|nr:hypothetical protein [Clostridiales bacterium]
MENEKKYDYYYLSDIQYVMKTRKGKNRVYDIISSEGKDAPQIYVASALDRLTGMGEEWAYPLEKITETKAIKILRDFGVAEDKIKEFVES